MWLSEISPRSTLYTTHPRSSIRFPVGGTGLSPCFLSAAWPSPRRSGPLCVPVIRSSMHTQSPCPKPRTRFHVKPPQVVPVSLVDRFKRRFDHAKVLLDRHSPKSSRTTHTVPGVYRWRSGWAYLAQRRPCGRMLGRSFGRPKSLGPADPSTRPWSRRVQSQVLLDGS